MNKHFDLTEDLKEIIAQNETENIVSGVSMLHIFRMNYDLLREAMDTHKVRKDKSITGTKKIIDLFLKKGFITSPDELLPNSVCAYMSQIKKERSKAKKENHSIAIKNGIAKSKEVEVVVEKAAPIHNNLVLTGITELRFPGITKHKLDWKDPTWTIEDWKKKFTDWQAIREHHNEFPNGLRPKKLEDGTYEWNDFFECLWRHLYNVAKEHEISAYDQTYYAGMKKVSQEHGKIWKDLHEARKTLKDKEGLNPVGVGGL